MTKNQVRQNKRFKSEKHEKDCCRTCETIHPLTMITSGDDHNDFGARHCPYCGQSTEHLSKFIDGPAVQINLYVLITLTGGLIDQARFFTDERPALEALTDFIRVMEIEDQDAAIYTPEGCYANAKDFLIENDEFI